MNDTKNKNETTSGQEGRLMGNKCKTDPVGMPLGGPSFGGDEVPTDTVQPQGFTLDSEKYPEEPAADNWAHRSAGMKCSSCMWFVEKATISSPVSFGRCRRHSPTLSGWPAVYGSDWCGDSKLDENKI